MLLRVYSIVLRPIAIIRVVLHDHLRLPLARAGVKAGVGICAWDLTEWYQRLIVSYRSLDIDLYGLQFCMGVSIVKKNK